MSDHAKQWKALPEEEKQVGVNLIDFKSLQMSYFCIVLCMFGHALEIQK